MPFIIAVYDYVRNERRKPAVRDDTMDRTLYASLAYDMSHSNTRFMAATGLLSLGGFLGSMLRASWVSNYICPLASHEARRIQSMQIASVFLDAIILIAAAEISREAFNASNGKPRQLSRLFGLAFLVWNCSLGPGRVYACQGWESPVTDSFH